MNTSEEQKKPGPPKNPPIREEDIQGFKYLDAFFKTLKRFHDVKDHKNRELHYDQYLALILLYFFSPVLTSLRGIQQATTLEKIQERLGIKETSLGSLSEASQVFDAKLLVPLLKELAEQTLPREKDPELKQIQQLIKAVDGTLLPALPKMLWALWQDDQHRAAKLHLEMDIFNQAPSPPQPSLPTATAMKRKSSKPCLLPIRSTSSTPDTQNTNSWATSSRLGVPSSSA